MLETEFQQDTGVYEGTMKEIKEAKGMGEEDMRDYFKAGLERVEGR
jgi:hypothetical protein